MRELHDVKASVKDKELCSSIETSSGICCAEILFVTYTDTIFTVLSDKRNSPLEMFAPGLSVALISCSSYVTSIWICLFTVNTEGLVAHSFCWVIVA